MSDHRWLVSLLDHWAAILPQRIAEEDIGGFIEALNRGSRSRFGSCLLVVQAVLATGSNTIREIPFLVDKKLLRRIAMWIAVINTLFAISLVRNPIEVLAVRSPGPLLFAQCLVGVILSLFWIGSGMAVWRRWPLGRQLAVGTAAATILFNRLAVEHHGYVRPGGLYRLSARGARYLCCIASAGAEALEFPGKCAP